MRPCNKVFDAIVLTVVLTIGLVLGTVAGVVHPQALAVDPRAADPLAEDPRAADPRGLGPYPVGVKTEVFVDQDRTCALTNKSTFLSIGQPICSLINFLSSYSGATASS